MASIRRAAMRSLETDPVQREFEIGLEASPIKRAGLLAIHRATTKHQRITARALGAGKSSSRVPRLGSGWVSDVYRIGPDTVMKVDKYSVGLSKRERRVLAQRMEDEHAALVAYVGPAVLAHEIDIGPHPVDRFLTAVRITQPYVKVDFMKTKLDGGSGEGLDILSDRIRHASRACPGIAAELGAVVDGSRALYDERQLAIDFAGEDNVGVDQKTGHFTVVDATYQH